VERFAAIVDKLWSAVLIAVTGETFREASGSRCVCGVVVSLRERRASSGASSGAATAKLALWINDAGNKEQVEAVGRNFREVLSDAIEEADVPRGGLKLAFEDFRSRSVTRRC